MEEYLQKRLRALQNEYGQAKSHMDMVAGAIRECGTTLAKLNADKEKAEPQPVVEEKVNA